MAPDPCACLGAQVSGLGLAVTWQETIVCRMRMPSSPRPSHGEVGETFPYHTVTSMHDRWDNQRFAADDRRIVRINRANLYQDG